MEVLFDKNGVLPGPDTRYFMCVYEYIRVHVGIYMCVNAFFELLRHVTIFQGDAMEKRLGAAKSANSTVAVGGNQDAAHVSLQALLQSQESGTKTRLLLPPKQRASHVHAICHRCFSSIGLSAPLFS